MKRIRSTVYDYVPSDVGEPLPDLDSIPKKSIKTQIEEMILSGQRLQDARLAQLNLPDFSDDEVVDQINEYSSYDEVQAAIRAAESALARVKERAKGDGGGSKSDPSKSDAAKASDEKKSPDSAPPAAT